MTDEERATLAVRRILELPQPVDIEQTIDRAILQRLSQSLFQRSIDACQQALDAARMKPNEITEVVICGGTAKIPFVRAGLEQFFGRQILPTVNMGIGGEEKLGTGVNLYMQIDGDIDAYYDEVKKKGVKIIADIKDEPFGIRDFTVEDNSGYQLTFNVMKQ